MSLSPGVRLGPYEITALIGEGGMGKVWRARHTALNRDDALKVLPDAFASDPDRLARFQREAQVLASLNHPNIAHVYGLEHADGVQALVMELVEGPTLADRIAQGPISIDQALPIARQIAEALEAAHEQGIIHRDLKPANIKLRPDGTPKVLDFGLAKALEPVSARGMDATASPTVTSPAMMTGIGMLLGTAAYMSPEQARGKVVDKRSDIWAFGCVLYEMLTGKRAFAGEEVSDVLASVLAREPDWTLLPHSLSPLLGTFLRHCLHKDRKQRIGDAQSLRLALEGAFETTADHAEQPVAVSQPAWRRPLVVAMVTAVVSIVATGIAGWWMWPPPGSQAVHRFAYDLPANQLYRGTTRHVMALSPDGRYFVYNTTNGLYLRSMAALEAHLIRGTEANSVSPFFSPDGESVGYFDGAQLKRISISGGAPVVICAATNPFGVSWAGDNTILFGQAKGIMRVSANGGTPELVIPAKDGEQLYGPQLMPDTDRVLFSVTTASAANRWDAAQIVVQSLSSGARTVVLQGGSDARYVPTGHVVYALEDGLFAVAFDAEQLKARGGPISLAEGIMRAFPPGASAAGNYAVSDEGTLVYVLDDRSGQSRTLVWVDRQGREEPINAPARFYQYPRLSPDGSRVALDLFDEIWIWDLTRETLTRFTFEPTRETYPVWTPDGQKIIFGSAQSGPLNLFWKPADGSGAAQRLTQSPNLQYPTSMSPDGTRVVFREDAASQDLMTLALTGEHRVEPLIQTRFNELDGEISPDGRWLAYQSDESGEMQVYVRPFSGDPGGIRQISTAGGTRPLWSRNGQELFYLAPTGALMSVAIRGGATWTASAPARLFEGAYFSPPTGAIGRTYDVSPDGKRFLMIKSAAGTGRIVVVQNWFEELKRLVPTN